MAIILVNQRREHSGAERGPVGYYTLGASAPRDAARHRYPFHGTRRRVWDSEPPPAPAITILLAATLQSITGKHRLDSITHKRPLDSITEKDRLDSVSE